VSIEPIGRLIHRTTEEAELPKSAVVSRNEQLQRGNCWSMSLFVSIVGKAYWDWFSRFNVYRVYQEAVELANVSLNQGVKQNARFRGSAAMDTVESGEVQFAKIGQIDSFVNRN